MQPVGLDGKFVSLKARLMGTKLSKKGKKCLRFFSVLALISGLFSWYGVGAGGISGMILGTGLTLLLILSYALYLLVGLYRCKVAVYWNAADTLIISVPPACSALGTAVGLLLGSAIAGGCLAAAVTFWVLVELLYGSNC